MPDSKTFSFPGTYRADCGHTHDFDVGSPVIPCPDCGDRKKVTWTWIEGEISPATVMQQIGWHGSTLTLMYKGVPPVSDESREEIASAIQMFFRDCQLMTAWFVGIMSGREVMRTELEHLASSGKPLRISTLRPDGREAAVLVDMPTEEVIESIADAGDFERLYANLFVVSMFHLWEESIRPKIASNLKVKPCHVKADLMGEWRLLRNWVTHRSKDAEDAFFERGQTLANALSLERGNLSLTVSDILYLVQRLNNMKVEVNPYSLRMELPLEPDGPELIAGVARGLEPGMKVMVPFQAGMAPSPAFMVFNEASAMVHEKDCSQVEIQLQAPADWRCVMVSDSRIGSSAVKLLELEEQLCRECGSGPP